MVLSISTELVSKGQDGGANKNSDQFEFWLSTYYQLTMALDNTLNSQFLIYKMGTILKHLSYMVIVRIKLDKACKAFPLS